jgi:hypothetical protein
MLMVLFEMDDVASRDQDHFHQPSFDDVVEYDDMVTSVLDEQHVASLDFGGDVVVVQQLNLDRKTWQLQHRRALLYRMFEDQSLDLMEQVDTLALVELDLNSNYLALNT